MLGEILSWTFSTISNIAWLFVFLPQLMENYNKKSSDAVSFYLIALWYIGDTEIRRYTFSSFCNL